MLRWEDLFYRLGEANLLMPNLLVAPKRARRGNSYEDGDKQD